MDFNKCTISENASVVDVLKRIDELPSLQTVFVLNNNQSVVGTITDGDIRRGFISGLSLDDSLADFYYTDFAFIEQDKNNFSKLKEFRRRRLKAVPLLNKKRELVKIIDFTKAKSILPLDAVIMAGGLGKRLLPLTANLPKPLLKVGDKEIISYNFDRLFQYGVTRQYVTVNYQQDKMIDFCNEYNDDINFRIVKEDTFLGTAGALSLIDDFHNDVVLLMNSDLLTNIDYEDFYLSFLEHNADMMVASIPYNVDLPYAILDTDDRQVKSFEEKPSYTYYANAGIYLLKKEMINLIPKGEVFNATDLMDEVVRQGGNMMHYPIRSYWLDIGKHVDYEKAQRDVAHIKWD